MSDYDPPGTAERTVPGIPSSVADARTWASSWLEKFGVPGGAAADAVLVLSELATNSVLHSRSSQSQGTYLVRLRRGMTQLRLEVTDAGGVSEPMARRNGHPRPLAESGHGLALVECFSTRWWTRADSRGRTVGAEIALNEG